MPLGKAKQVEWMREYRKRQKGVIPSVIPNTVTLETTTVIPKSPSVIPNIVSQVKRLYPDGRLPNCPDGRFRLDAGITLCYH